MGSKIQEMMNHKVENSKNGVI